MKFARKAELRQGGAPQVGRNDAACAEFDPSILFHEPPILMKQSVSARRRRTHRTWLCLAAAIAGFAPADARASLFHGETLDAVANGISWAVLVIAPLIGITVFWLVHILPEKIAHKRKHPQT